MMHTDNLAESAPEGVEPVSAENSVTVGREDLHPARNNTHLLVDAFPPGRITIQRNPIYMKEDDENV